MKIKIILTIIFLLFLNGCSIEYNLEILEDKTYNETIYINNIKENNHLNMTFKDVRNAFYEKLPDYKITIPEYSTKNIKANITNKKLTSLKFSDIINYTYYNKSSNINELILEPNTEMLDSIFYDIANEDKPTGAVILVNITIPFEITYTNANDAKGNTYIWRVDKDNYRKIEIKYNSNQIKKTEKQKTTEATLSIIILLFLSITLISGVITTIYKYKNRNGDIG